MSGNVTALFNRGFTYTGGTPDAIAQSSGSEGAICQFKDEYRSGSGVLVKRSNQLITAMCVRNVSGIALTPGRLVRWKALFRGKRVDGYTTTTTAEVAGVVDDALPSTGVANNDLFWLIRKGPCLVKTPLVADVSNVFTENDILIAMTAVTSQSTTAGRPITWALTATSTGTTDGTGALYIINRIGRAMSAKTTANTNADLLCDLQLM
jgi:hypothetical protein